MSPARIGIIGAGMAGPVLAVFLKAKGYDPVLFERTDSFSDSGLGIGIQRNGLQLLAKVPGLFECVRNVAFEIDGWETYSTVEEDKGLLGVSDHPRHFKEKDGFGTVAIRRSVMQKTVIRFAEKAGVQIFWGHKLEALEQGEENVTVTFSNGVKETFSFIVGCDGLHSSTRTCIIGEQPATYTGLSQWGGIAPRPECYRGQAVIRDFYGTGCGMIMVPWDDSTIMWAFTLREPESKETWRAVDAAAAEVFKNSVYGRWDFGAGEAIRNSTYIIRYGLYDRPELKSWHVGRVVLIGDAAHPTSPHIGQGANQSFEDIGVLVDLLEQHNPSAESPATKTLETVFQELETIRIPRSSSMVQRARAQGDSRVVEGVEASIKRNNDIREMFKSGEFYKRRLDVSSVQ